MSSQTAFARAPAPGCGPGFDGPVPPGGYHWWHVDAESADGRHGITLAAVLGSPLAARGRAAGDALDHGAMLVCLRGAGRRYWSMTRRDGAEIMRWPQALVIGLNTVFASAAALSFGIDDVTAPWPGRVRGTVDVHLPGMPDRCIPLDAQGRHRWRPLGAVRVRVAMERPVCAWEGQGWADAHEGDAPLDGSFVDWSRSRASPGGDTLVAHAFRRPGGGVAQVACRVDAAGGTALCETAHAALPPTRWRLPRHVPADRDGAARVIATLADTPLYARTLAEAPLSGETALILHETLSFERLRRRWGRLLLAMRSPRAWT